MTTSCFIAFGGNLGDVRARFQECWQALDESADIAVLQTSSIYQSQPMGNAAGEPFCNAAAELNCSLTPHVLLDRLQNFENRFGRKRDIRWGPRTLDLDILLFGDEVIRTSRLEVPHPGVFYRRFVLDPLCDIAAAVRHPLCDCSIAELRSRLLKRPLPIAIDVSPTEQRDRIVQSVTSQFPQVCVIHDLSKASLTLFADGDTRTSESYRGSSQVDLARINSNLETAAIDAISAAIG